jgi:hypothetical protein
MKILIKAVGYIGDNLFGSSIAQKLKEEHPGCTVDYLLNMVQPYELISNDPYIDNVYLEAPNKQYDIVHQLQPIHRKLTPCEQFQIQCGVKNPSPYFKIYTNPSLDNYVKHLFKPLQGKIIVAWLSNWEERSFGFTEEEYKAGVNVPNLGYGGRRRDISYIINELEKNPNIYLVEVGKPNGTNQLDFNLFTLSEYSLTASIIKNCNYFIGAEGGLANLAYGVGTKTILTDDFVHQLYGWNGVIEKCEDPKLGPKYYSPNDGHITLDAYLKDNEVVNELNKLLQ